MKVAKVPLSIPSRSRLGLTLIIVFMVMSSPILIFSSPISVSAKGSNNADTSNLHSAFSLEAASPSSASPLTSMSPTNVSPMDSDFTTQAALSLTRATQTDNLVNSKTYYDISFRTTTAGVIKTVQMAFPVGTYVGAAVLIEAVGIGPGTIAASGTTATGMTLTYTVTNEVNVPALTRIRIQVANVNNPQDPSNSLTVTITTRDPANNIIDGPTATNAYNIKQIATNDIADLSITNPKLADGVVTSSKLNDNAVTTPKIVDNAVTTDKIEDSQVNTNDLADSSVTNSKLASDAVTTDKIAEGNIGTNDIADNAVTTPKIADDSITTDKISDGSVSTNDIADSAVTTPKIADDAVTTAKIKEDLVHVVWKSNPGPNFDIIYKRDGAGFDPSTLTPQLTGGPQGEPAIAVSGNNVYLVWQEDFGGGSLEVIYTRSTDGGANFDPLQLLSVTPGPAFNPSVVVSGNNVYVVWQENLGGGNNDIMYRRSTDGGSTFSGTIINLSNNAGLSITPRVAASGNNVHVVWFDTAPGNNEILYRRSTDGGGTFDPTTNLSNNTGNSGNPAIAVSGNNVHVVWFDSTPGNDEILYRRSIDGGVTFDAAVNISNDATNSNFPSIAVSGNNIHVVWIDDTASNDEIFYRRSLDGGVNFDITTNLSTRAGISTAPDVAVSGNNVYVVWQENLTPFASFAINYSMSTDGGATFEPQLSSLSNYWISDNRFPKIAVS